VTPARRRQQRLEAAKRNAIAQEVADRSGETPHLDGDCPECREGEAHVAYTNSIGRVVYMRRQRRAWWRRLLCR
jgi:hypothetical protein